MLHIPGLMLMTSITAGRVAPRTYVSAFALQSQPAVCLFLFCIAVTGWLSNPFVVVLLRDL